MADVKTKPHPSARQRKFRIYQALFNLNAAFESIGREIEVLDDCKAIPLETLWRCRVAAEELRAGLKRSAPWGSCRTRTHGVDAVREGVRARRKMETTPEGLNSAAPPVVAD